MATTERGEADELRKIGNLLALMLIREMSGPEKVKTLNTCGFSNKEAAGILGVTEGYIRTTLSRQRKRTADEAE